MATVENLRPQSERTPEERSRIAKMGNKASQEARKKKKQMREFAEFFGAMGIEVKLPDGRKQKTTFDGAVVFAQYQKAIREGNTKAAAFLAQLKGEMEQNINVTSEQPLVVVRSEDEKQKITNLDKLGV